MIRDITVAVAVADTVTFTSLAGVPAVNDQIKVKGEEYSIVLNNSAFLYAGIFCPHFNCTKVPV